MKDFVRHLRKTENVHFRSVGFKVFDDALNELTVRDGKAFFYIGAKFNNFFTQIATANSERFQDIGGSTCYI